MITYEEIKDEIIKNIIDINSLEREDNKGVHNFSYPTLQSYFYLKEMINYKKPPLLTSDLILFLPSKQGKYKTFCYKPLGEERKSLLEKMRKMGPIYSIHSIPFLKGEIQFKEVGYSLRDVFSSDKYPNAKKRYQKLVYPFKQQEKFKVVTREATDEEVKNLHDEWVERKMADPNTFRMMFPNKRYYSCYIKAKENPQSHKIYTFFIEDKLIAVRVLGIQGRRVFDLANFGRVWDSFSNMMNTLDTCVLKNLYELGFEEFNCGAGLNKKLKLFKEHYPSFEIISYQYSKTK